MSNIPTGYKQTEVGVIPEDWATDKIKNLASITTGSKNTQDRVDSGEYPFFVRSQTVERINSYSFNGEAVLTAGDGVGTGKVFHYIKGKFDFHQRVYKVSDFKDEIDGYYFFLYFSNNFFKRIMQMTAKSSVDSVRMEMIADMQVPLPPTKAEQTAIANALSDADALIQSLEKLIAKKRNIKQGAMQKCLNCVSYDLYDEDDLKIQKKNQGNQKNHKNHSSDKWVMKKLGEILKVKHGRSQKDVVVESGEYPIIATGGIIGKARQFLYDKPSVLIGRKGTIDDPQFAESPFWAIDTIFYTELSEAVVPKFIFYRFVLIDWYSHNEASGVPSLNAKTIENIEIHLPPLKEQTRIATILSDMDAEISALETRLTKYKQIKQGMMQELLTGRIRLV
ncbi:MAG: restriction endonuclease subunit S [Nitrospirae bacterium]|nr:restriction endonuclease subunit S [Nitrospirota bacterium]